MGKSTVKTLLTLLTLFVVLTGCGGGGKKTTYEVNGPAGDHVGAEQFSNAMVMGQAIYGESSTGGWGRMKFFPSGDLEMWTPGGDHYTWGWYINEDDGLLYISGEERSGSVISLVQANPYSWVLESEGTESTYHLELKITEDMVVGKRFSVETNRDGEIVRGFYEFREDGTFIISNEENELLEETTYIFRDGTFFISIWGEREVNLIRVEDGKYRIWLFNNSQIWTPM